MRILTTLRFHARDASAPVVVELAANEAVLVGRQPLVAALDPAKLPVAPQAVTLVTVPSALVSENHLLAWSDGTSVTLVDLRSTNGSRWRLPPRREVRALAKHDIDLELGSPADAAPGGPAPAEWSDGPSFREGVAREVGAWLAGQGLPARARLVGVAESDALPRECVSLGEGWALRIDDTRGSRTSTEHPALARAVDEVWAYVRAQRGEFEVFRDSRHDDLVLESPAMQALHRRICKAARHGLGGILQGESGVGKSALARCFHDHSERRDGPYVETNLGEDSDDRKFFQLKLFGARAGAATGITRDRVGLVRAAHKGTLFLDEVALLPLNVQGMLLRFLDTGTFRRLGDDGEAPPERADVRVVAGTNVDLRENVRKGTFREDLWWRLSGVVLEIPPLRARREDVAAYLDRTRVDLGRGPRGVLEALDADARALLCERYAWPGNFRELRSFVSRLPLYAASAEPGLAACEEALRAGNLGAPPATLPPPSPSVPPALAGRWEELMPLALELLPRWVAARPQRASSEPSERRRDARAFEFQIFVDEVLKPLCLARVLGVEHWDELPRRPDPSYQVLADRIGYSDGKSVQENLRLYVELKRLMR